MIDLILKSIFKLFYFMCIRRMKKLNVLYILWKKSV